MRAEGCRGFRQGKIGRRALLQAGTLGALGLGLPQLLAGANPLSGSPGLGRAKRCLFIFLWGGPSQLDTLDPKPDAPAEVRGEFQTIPTRVAGLRVCEHLPLLAERADRVAVVRSLHHTDPAHLSSAHATLTGHWAPVINSDAEPPSPRDAPQLGALVGRLKPSPPNLPAAVTLPWKAYHPAAPGGVAPGQHGGWLGAKYDPLLATGDPNQPEWKVPALELAAGMSGNRLQDRHRLLRHLDQQRRALDESLAAARLEEHQRRALSLLSSSQVRAAFDLGQEPAEVRERYGRNTHGQCVLLGRRLLEHGVPLVTVNWHNDGKAFWDTHGDNFNRLKNDLLPPADQALAALMDDLQQRGLWEDTIVAWVGEFGRNPQISKNNAGREHWPFCYSGLLTGGPVRGGTVFGTSDRNAAYPARDPVTPLDYAATLLHALGIAHDQVLHDRDGRPHRIYAGRPVLDLLA